MANVPSVTVQSAIVHITDRNMPAPVYSEVELNLAASPAIRGYFEGQVGNALGDSLGAALFAETDPHDARDACHRVLSGTGFVEASQTLAELVHRAMRTHGSIAPGSLAVCTYTVADDPALTLALIKLDPASGLVQQVVDDHGNRLVSFQPVDKVMPTARERLQKAALVALPDEKRRYDLLLLDRQTPEVAAAWWAETFLNSVPVYDGRRGAKDFQKTILSAYDVLMKDKLVTPAEGETLHQHAEVAMHGKAVNRRRFVRELPFSEPAKEVVEKHFEKRFRDMTRIPIDPVYASEVVKKTRYEGEYGVVIEYETASKKYVVLKEEQFDRKGTPVTRLLLEVPNLRRVK